MNLQKVHVPSMPHGVVISTQPETGDVYVHIMAGTQLTTPFELQTVVSDVREQPKKIVITVESNACVTIYDTLTVAEQETPLSRLVEYHLKQNATVFVRQRHDVPAGMHCDDTLIIQLAAQSRYEQTSMFVCAGTATYAYAVHMLGEHASATIKGVYAVTGNGHVTLSSYQHHKTPKTESRVLFKGVVSGAAHAEYAGTIRIEPGAHQSSAEQDNHVLLLSAQARASGRPCLEVLTDDVRCAHGSAMGSLDEQQMWYVQSRGLSSEQAQKLLLRGFCATMVDDAQVLERVIERVMESSHA